jgi:transcriptional regulator with XRE-family HTH domain
MITGPQIRAARALLGWSGADLAIRAGISYPTVQRAETATGIPGLRLYNLIALKRTLEVGGVIFLAQGELRDGGPGVRLPHS